MKPAFQAASTITIRLTCSCFGLLALNAAVAEPSPPEILITAETNDNPRLRANDPLIVSDEPASRLIAEARFGFVRSTPRSELAFLPAVRSDAYFDPADESLESTDVFLRGRGQRRWQRASLGFNVDLSREKLLGTEFLDPQPGEVDDELPNVDGTLLGINEIRTRAVFAPYTQVQFGQRSALRLDLRATDVTYDDDPAALSSRADFTDWEAGAAYVRTLNPRTTLSTRVFGTRFEALAIGNQANTVGLELRLARDLSSIWSIVAIGGVAQIDFIYVDAAATRVAGTNDTFVLDLGLHRRTERASLDFDLRRRLLPDSFGFLVTRSELEASLLRSLSPRVRGGVTLHLIESAAFSGAPDGGRDYGRFGLNIEWAFVESWSLIAGYEHYYWINAAIDHDARSNSVLVGFNYRKSAR